MNMIAFFNYMTGLAEGSGCEASSVAVSEFIDNVMQNSEIKG